MNTADIQRIAELARLSIPEADLEAFAAQFERILDYVGTINALPMDGVEPQTSINAIENVTREDVVGETASTEEALRNAPKKNEAFFKVPKVLG
ncbi:MAG: Asp-tRNA(Asn)/Glu-tRNA(Gln) amidotransferase subunit GatC [Candidatus Kapabacteria bacterium]|nr:Asp-tRNA(Asn)/Glu-tRNA(Gln) amidotransferase subunit GatC [Candidatus Kapabacteria bacterium]